MALRALVLMLAFLASVPIAFVRPMYGILAWIVVAFVSPQSYLWDAFDAFPWAVSVAIPTIAGMLLFDRNLRRLASWKVVLLLLLWAWFGATTYISMNAAEFVHHAADTWERWVFVSKVLIMTVCMIPVVTSFERLRSVVLTIGACFGLYVLKSVAFVIATGGAFRVYGPDRSMIADNNDFGLALNMTLPLYFFLAQTEAKRWVRWSLVALFVLTIPAIFFTYSRGALVGLVVVGASMILQARRRLALLPAIALAVVVALYFAPDAWRQRMDPTRPDVIDGSAMARLDSWAYARALAADHPIAGGGFATFTPELYLRYTGTDADEALGPHSVYFQLLAEHGYIGLGLYLVLVVSCLLTTFRLRWRARRQGDREIALYAQMFQFALIGFLSSGAFLGRAYFDYFFALVACIIILERAARDRWALTERAAEAPALIAPEIGQAFAAGA